MRYVVLLASVVMFTACAAMAQEEAAGQENEAEQTTVSEGTDMPGLEALSDEPAGDVVVLKDGRRLENVQVLRRTTTDFEIEVVEGTPPMALPRTMVETVEWDDYDPLGLNIADTSAAAPASGGESEAGVVPEGMARDDEGNVEMLPGVKVPAALAGKLRKDITAQVPEFKGKKLFDVLNLIKQATQLPIVPDKPLMQVVSKSPDGFNVDVTLKDDEKVNVAQFFHNYLLKQAEMKNVAVVYEPNRVLVTTKAAARKIQEEKEEAEGESTQETP